MAKKVQVDIKTTGAGKASKDLGKVDKGLGGLAKSAAKVAGGFFAARGLLAGFQAVINVTREQELAEKQLNAVLKSTASVAGLTARELTNMASALQKQTRFGDEAIIKAQSLMLTFTKVGKDVFPDAIETVLNMSEAMGQDLQQGVIQVGKALNDPILGVTALRRVGVQLSEQQEQQVRDFVEVNDVASAQKIILEELETQFGGVAKAAGDTMAGQLDKMKNAVGDAGEALGTALAPVIISVAEGLVTAANAASNFFKRLTETDLEAIVREMGELEMNTLSFEVTLARINKIGAEGAAFGLRDAKEIAQDIENRLPGLEKLYHTLFKEEEKLHEAGTSSTALTLENIHLIAEMIDLRKEAGEVNFFDNIRLFRKNKLTKEGVVLARQAVEEELEKIEQLKEDLKLATDRETKQVIYNQLLERQNKIQKIIGEGSKEENKDTEGILNVQAELTKSAQNQLKTQIQQGKVSAENTLKLAQSLAAELVMLKLKNLIQSKINAKKQKELQLTQATAAAGAVGGGILGFIGGLFQTGGSYINRFQGGGSFNVNRRTILPTNPPAMVGDNASGMERIDVTPLPSPTSNGNNITINISAPLVDETVVDTIIPAIRRAEKLNL
jgi:hypothetical protein|tara:strand:+ start:276 stop:2120 length:1845 start_codon:yes stop_codon:yes gene_type:complete